MGRTKFSEAGPKRKNAKSGAASLAAKNGFDGLADAPWRKTPSIFKQPVTLVRTSSSNKKMPDTAFVSYISFRQIRIFRSNSIKIDIHANVWTNRNR